MGNQLYKGRTSIENQIYHITSCTYNRTPIFLDFQTARVVINEMKTLHTEGLVSSMAWVVMPDHIHWLFQLTSSSLLSGIVKKVKARSALKIRSSINQYAPKIWQKGFHDHAIRNEESLIEVARYIVANPLRAGLVTNIGKYPHWDAIWLHPL